MSSNRLNIFVLLKDVARTGKRDMSLYIVHTYLSVTVEYIHHITDMTVSPYSPYSIPRAAPVFIIFIRKTRIQDIQSQCQTLRWDNVRHVLLRKPSPTGAYAGHSRDPSTFATASRAWRTPPRPSPASMPALNRAVSDTARKADDGAEKHIPRWRTCTCRSSRGSCVPRSS